MKLPAVVALAHLFVLAPGCYASHGLFGDAGSSRADAAAADARPVPTDAGICEPFPPFDRRCSGPDECSIGVHQIDCCGTHRALGLAERVRASFSELEVDCRNAMPACDCPPGPTVADDESTAFSDMPAVACIDGICVSSFRDD